MYCGSCSRKIVEAIEKHSELFYICATRCASAFLYDSLLALSEWNGRCGSVLWDGWWYAL